MNDSVDNDTSFAEMKAAQSHRQLDFEDAYIVPGIVNGTYFLIVSGTKPYMNMVVELMPFIYVRQPDYWGFEVVGSLPGGIGLPALADYTVSKDLSGVTGKKGVEVFGIDYSRKLAVPPVLEERLESLKGLAQLCNERGDVEYRANQVKGTVYLIASGMHGTPGYKVFFEQSPIEIFPPQFILKHRGPGGIDIQVMTPFVAVTQFAASNEITELVVWDAQGKHIVPVDQTPN